MSNHNTRSNVKNILKQMEENVKLANKITNPLNLVLSQKNFISEATNKMSNDELSFKHYDSKELTRELRNWIMDLISRNMRLLYLDCDWGWNPDEKLTEITNVNARFVIAFKQENPIGFTHYRFDMDYERPVVYCYELQLEVSGRKFGLGRHLMEILEEMGRLAKMNFVVLTVLKKNSAIGFFQKIGYSLDDTSPDEDEEDVSYFIYSKEIMIS